MGSLTRATDSKTVAAKIFLVSEDVYGKCHAFDQGSILIFLYLNFAIHSFIRFYASLLMLKRRSVAFLL